MVWDGVRLQWQCTVCFISGSLFYSWSIYKTAVYCDIVPFALFLDHCIIHEARIGYPHNKRLEKPNNFKNLWKQIKPKGAKQDCQNRHTVVYVWGSLTLDLISYIIYRHCTVCFISGSLYYSWSTYTTAVCWFSLLLCSDITLLFV
jgi:hypothetical protein